MLTMLRERTRPIHDPMADYFMVRVIHRTDKQAIETLEDRYDIPTWYPQIVELKPIPLRKLSLAQRACGLKIMRPLPSAMFPRYVLVQYRKVDWRVVFEQAGIGGFACAGEKIVRMRPHEVAKIRQWENGDMIAGDTKLKVLFEVGDEVTITSGPFASFSGIVEKGLDVAIGDLDPEARIKIAMNLFGRSTSAEFEVWQVAKH